MYFEIVGEISDVETIAVGSSIREVERLRKLRDPHGRGRWRKLKGYADVILEDGGMCRAEIHWYEAHGIGKRDLKIKRIWG